MIVNVGLRRVVSVMESSPPSVRAVGALSQNALTSGTMAAITPTHQAGDLLICHAFSGILEDSSISNGWQQLLTNSSVRILWKVATSASEPNLVINNRAGGLNMAVMFSVKDANQSISPFDWNLNSGSVTTNTISWPNNPTTVNNCMVINFYAKSLNDVTLTGSNSDLTSFGKIYDLFSTESTDFNLIAFSGIKSVAGAISNTTATGGTNEAQIISSIAIKPI